jgi:hypothetical protein
MAFFGFPQFQGNDFGHISESPLRISFQVSADILRGWHEIHQHETVSVELNIGVGNGREDATQVGEVLNRVDSVDSSDPRKIRIIDVNHKPVIQYIINELFHKIQVLEISDHLAMVELVGRQEYLDRIAVTMQMATGAIGANTEVRVIEFLRPDTVTHFEIELFVDNPLHSVSIHLLF